MRTLKIEETIKVHIIEIENPPPNFPRTWKAHEFEDGYTIIKAYRGGDWPDDFYAASLEKAIAEMKKTIGI